MVETVSRGSICLQSQEILCRLQTNYSRRHFHAAEEAAARSAGIVDPVLQSNYGSSLAMRNAVFQGRRVDFHRLWQPRQTPMGEHGESGMHALKKSQ